MRFDDNVYTVLEKQRFQAKEKHKHKTGSNSPSNCSLSVIVEVLCITLTQASSSKEKFWPIKLFFGTIWYLKSSPMSPWSLCFPSLLPVRCFHAYTLLTVSFISKGFFFACMICTFHAVGFFDHLSLKTFTPSNVVLSAISSTPIVLCANLNLHLRLFRLTCLNFPLFFSKGTGSGF